MVNLYNFIFQRFTWKMIIAYFLWFDFWTLITNNFESHNSVKLSFRNIWGLCSNFCWLRIFPWIKLSWHSCSVYGLTVYVKEGLPLARDLSLESSADSYLCFGLALFFSVSYFFFLYRSPFSSLCTVFNSISSDMDEVLSISPSANVFVFGDFNAHHGDWITYSGGTDRPGELCYNSSTSDDMTLVGWLAFLLGSQALVLTVLLFWISVFLQTQVFVLHWLSLHWEILIMLLSIKFSTRCPVS